MKKLLVSILLGLSLILPASVAANPPPPQLGTLTVVQQPVTYGQIVGFSWSLPRAVRNGTIGLFCTQAGGAQWEYIAEYPFSGSQGTASWILDNSTSSAVPGTLDYTQHADCNGYAWDERLVAQGKDPYVTNSVYFPISGS